MKIILKTIFITTLLSLSLLTACKEPEPSTSQPSRRTVSGTGTPIGHKPGGRSESMINEIMAHYDGGILTITFDVPEGRALVELSDTGGSVVYSACHQSDAPIVISEFKTIHPLQIRLFTSEGHEYEGLVE